jgi:hypothetical protein
MPLKIEHKLQLKMLETNTAQSQIQVASPNRNNVLSVSSFEHIELKSHLVNEI